MRTKSLATGLMLCSFVFACGSEGDGNAVVFVVAADGGADSMPPPDSPPSTPSTPAPVLAKGIPTAPDAACPNGSTTVEIGTDDNGNGQLDSSEARGSLKVCASSPAVLSVANPTGPSAKCPQGGTTVDAGADANGNGKLDRDEVSSSLEICTNAIVAELSESNPITEGQRGCPFGGVETKSGIDDGKGGGSAGDGELQDGEVLHTEVVCTNGSVSSLSPPNGPIGTSRILTSGGRGSAGVGGNGGLVNVGTSYAWGSDDGLLGGNVKIFRTGSVDGHVDAPAIVPAFGTMKLDVTEDLAIVSRSSSALAADGEFYLMANSGILYRQNAANPQVVVTGIHVAKGKTLKFPASNVSIVVSGDFHNEGTVTSGATGVNHGSLSIIVHRFIGTKTSRIILSGTPQAAGPGGNGGNLTIESDSYSDEGTIDTSGADGDVAGTFAGGNAGLVTLRATAQMTSGPLYRSGVLMANGGSGKAAGGKAGKIEITSASKSIYLGGRIEQSGGMGGTSGGAAGAFAGTCHFGDSIFDGVRIARGGDVDGAACTGACSGGTAATFTWYANGGAVVWNGDNLATPGASKGAPGLDGPSLGIATVMGMDPVGGVLRAGGRLRVTGTFDARGSNGTAGGRGGNVLVFALPESQPNGQEVELFGYSAIRSEGGDGTAGGGTGGTLHLENRQTTGGRLTGGLVVEPDLSVRGGSALLSGTGGDGGAAYFLAGTVGSAPTHSQVVLLEGALDGSGGDGVELGGKGALVELHAGERAYVDQDLVCGGGNAVTTGGNGGPITLTSTIATTLRGTVTSPGGSGAMPGVSGTVLVDGKAP